MRDCIAKKISRAALVANVARACPLHLVGGRCLPVGDWLSQVLDVRACRISEKKEKVRKIIAGRQAFCQEVERVQLARFLLEIL